MKKKIEKETGRYLPPRIEIGPYFPGAGDFQVLFLNTNPYYIGIVNLGWQTVIEYLLTASPFVSVRVEYADTIKDANLKASDFNLIAIHIPFETNYPTAVWMLRQIGLPIFSRKRSNSLPLVIAGGVYNPLPLADFVDIFVIGDGRLSLVELVNLCFSEKNKKEKVLEMAIEKKIKGIFIPSLRSAQDEIFASPELPLNEYPIYTNWSTENNIYGLSADYLSIMVALGCRYKCPFCLIAHCQGLGRNKEAEIDVSKVLEILHWRKQFIPVKTVKLFFASSVNREKLKEMLSELTREKVEVLVGSLNLEQIDEELVMLLKQSGQDRITIAPETCQSQRWKVNKGYITDERIFEIIKLANKYSLPLSLYLMYGLPGETRKDIIKLGELVKRVRQGLDRRLELEVHCNQVYLKPHTPWQYAEQISFKESISRFELFQKQLANISEIKIKTLDPYSSLLQSLLARADKRLSKLLISIAMYPPQNLEELIKKVQELVPDWQRYFREKEFSEISWSQIVFQNHKILWQRWLSLKRKLNTGGEKLL